VDQSTKFSTVGPYDVLSNFRSGATWKSPALVLCYSNCHPQKLKPIINPNFEMLDLPGIFLVMKHNKAVHYLLLSSLLTQLYNCDLKILREKLANIAKLGIMHA